MDVWTYFGQKEREFADLSLEPLQPPPGHAMFVAEAGTNGRRGRVLAQLEMGGSPVPAYIQVSERVTVVGQHMRRDEYAYFLVIEGEEVFGYERDLSHNPAVHAHGEGHERRQAGPIAFRAFAELAWAEVSKRTPAD